MNESDNDEDSIIMEKTEIGSNSDGNFENVDLKVNDMMTHDYRKTSKKKK